MRNVWKEMFQCSDLIYGDEITSHFIFIFHRDFTLEKATDAVYCIRLDFVHCCTGMLKG